MHQLPDKIALDDVARELRAAVLAADHEKVARLTVEYARAVAAYWMSLDPKARDASAVPKQSLELLTWVREMALMQQAMAAQQLAVLERASRYETARSHYLRSAALEA